jgi:hypothetical protein
MISIVFQKINKKGVDFTKHDFEEICKNTVEKNIEYIKGCIEFAEHHPDFPLIPGELNDGTWERYADDIRLELELTLFSYQHKSEVIGDLNESIQLDGFDSQAKGTVNWIFQLLNKYLEIKKHASP